jgi:hypothetical protein
LRRSVREHDLEHFPVFDTFLDAALYVVDHCRRANAAD